MALFPRGGSEVRAGISWAGQRDARSRSSPTGMRMLGRRLCLEERDSGDVVGAANCTRGRTAAAGSDRA